MVNKDITHKKLRSSEQGSLLIELILGLTIAGFVLIPMGFSIRSETKLTRSYYYHATAMEIVDGEMEVLLAGEWKKYQQGVQPFRVHAQAAKSLPQGNFILSLQNKKIRLM